MVDFPRPLFHTVAFIGEVPKANANQQKQLPDQFQLAVDDPRYKGFILISFGTITDAHMMPNATKVAASVQINSTVSNKSEKKLF